MVGSAKTTRLEMWLLMTIIISPFIYIKDMKTKFEEITPSISSEATVRGMLIHFSKKMATEPVRWNLNLCKWIQIIWYVVYAGNHLKTTEGELDEITTSISSEATVRGMLIHLNHFSYIKNM